ncbi:protein kinase [Candidatus Uabimicrobium sp. HlEnr_7]|uniref:protein kinase domain-containing protein n=1 Tax=Candidatus Uabimicrobium helgolandensis TaxID=3095367 RepID=UPI003558A039
MEEEALSQTTTYNKKLAKTLKNKGILNENTLSNFLNKCNQTGINLGQVLVQQKVISAHNLVEVIRDMNTGGGKNSQEVVPTKKFGKYKIIKELGRGGMGVVYLVEQPDIKRILVLKTLLPAVGSDPVQVKRFYKEAETVSTLHHPNIIPIYEFGKEKEMPYFTMQYIDGIDFQQLLDKEEQDRDLYLKILEKASRALHYAHQKEIVHRDIKPANIMLDKNNEPYLADFGLAKHQNKKSSLTQTGAVIGTPFYLSPEQVRGSRKAIDHRTDIYSLGVILYKILSGQFPFTAGEMPSLYRKILKELPTPPKKINTSIPSNLNYICLKAIAKNPEDRYQSAQALAEALKNFRQKKAIKNEERIKISFKYWWAKYHKLVSRALILVLSTIIATTMWMYSSSSYSSTLKKHQQIYYDVIDFVRENQYQKAIHKLKSSKENTPFILAAKAQIEYEWFNNPQKAHKYFSLAIKQDKNNNEILYAFSNFFFQVKKYSKALSMANRAIENSTPNSEYYRFRAQIHRKMRHNKEFKQDVAIATQIENSSINNSLEKLKNHKKKKNWTGALVVLNEIIGNYPHCEIAYYERAQIYNLRKETTAAINDITHAISLNPSSANYRLQAEWLLKIGQKEDALKSYQYLLSKTSESYIYQKILQLQIATQKFNEAITFYYGIPKQLQNIDSKLHLAIAYYHKQKYKKASEFLQQIPSQKTLVNYYLGISLYQLGKHKQASSILKKLLKIASDKQNTSLTVSQRVDIFYFSAKILQQIKKYKLSKKYLLKALEIDSSNVQINFSLAQCYKELSEYKSSLKHYSICIDLQPWKTNFYLQRGLVYRQMKKWALANYDFLKCVELKSNNVDLISYIYECGYREKDPFKKFTIQNTLKGRLLDIYDRVNLDLLQDIKHELAAKLLDVTLPQEKKYDQTKISLARSFLKTIVKNSSADVIQIASNGLQGLYYIHQVQELVKLRSEDKMLGMKTRLYLQELYQKLRQKYFKDSEIYVKQILARYFIALDQRALLELYQKRNKMIDVLKYLIYNENKEIAIRFYAAEALALLKTRNAINLLHEGKNSEQSSVSLICKIVLAKLKFIANPNILYKEIKTQSYFLKIKCIDHVDLNKQIINNLLEDSDPKVQLSSAKKMWLAGNQKPLRLLLRSLKSQNPLLQKFTLDTFWTMENHTRAFRKQLVDRYLQSLFHFADNSDPILRKIAIAKMKTISSPLIIPKIRKKLQDEDKDVRAQAISTLAIRGEIIPLLKITQDSTKDITMRLAPFSYFETGQSTSKIPIFKVLTFVSKILKDPDPRIRFIVITYLMRANDGKGARYSISLINLKDNNDRFAVALGIAQSGPQMLPYAEKFLETDKDRDVLLASAASGIYILLTCNDMNKLQKFHAKVKSYSPFVQTGGAFGYSYYLYERYYRISKLSSSIFHEVNNEYYDNYLLNIETEVPALVPEEKRIMLMCAQRAHEFNLKSNRCLLERAVMEYTCGKHAQSSKTLSYITGMEKNPSYLYWKARIYFSNGELQKAQQQIINAQKQRPWNKKYVLLHANIEKALGNSKTYVELMDRVKLLN